MANNLGFNIVWLTSTGYKRNRHFDTEADAQAYCKRLDDRKAKGEIQAYKCVKKMPLLYYVDPDYYYKHCETN